MMNATRQNLLEAIDVWSIHLADHQNEVEACRSLLSASELDRAAKFFKAKDAENFILCRGLLRRILGDALNADPSGLVFLRNSNGKPRLSGGELEFNISHSRDRLLIAVTSGRAVGVDIEFRRDNVHMDSISERWFSPDERESFHSSQHPKQTFFDIWAKKEALVKAQGQGIFNHSATPGADPNKWFVQPLEIDRAYSAVVVSETPVVPVTLRTRA